MLMVLIGIFSCAFAQEKIGGTINGHLIGINGNHLTLEVAPKVQVDFLVDKRAKIVSFDGTPYLQAWLLSGDGVQVHLNQSQQIDGIQVNVRWIAGTIAFVSPERVTLSEGGQFFLDSAPIFLNGEKILDVTELRSPEEILLRFDPVANKVVGAWVFDASALMHPPGESAKVQGNQLVVSTQIDNNKKHFVEIVGVTSPIPMRKRNGRWIATIPIPTNTFIPKCRVMIRGESSNFIFLPLTISTGTPQISEMGPSDASNVPINPPFIFVRWNSEFTGLDSESIQLFLDGMDVTPQIYRDSFFVFYTPKPLRAGKHECWLTGRTMGKSDPVKLHWSFQVNEDE